MDIAIVATGFIATTIGRALAGHRVTLGPGTLTPETSTRPGPR